jgi:hypothetical protein
MPANFLPLSNRLLEQLRQITGNPLSEWRAYLLYGVVKNSERYYHKNGRQNLLTAREKTLKLRILALK